LAGRGCLAGMARRRRRKKGSLKGALPLLLIFAVLGAVIEGFRLARENPDVLLLALLAIGGAVYGWRRWKAQAAEAERDALLGYDLSDLDILTGPAFEAWIAAVLQDAGFTTEDIQTSGDFGVDVIAEYQGTKFGIQAKRYKSNVGNSAVQEASAGAQFHGCSVSAVVTQSRFTRAAKAQAAGMRPPCLLIGRDELPEMVSILRQRA
jgi:restriction system protein